MSEIFDSCLNLTDIEMPNFSTESATNMQYMFRNCYSLQDIDLSGFDTENVTNMQGMFESCSSLRHIDVSGFDTRKVTNMRRMFGYTALSELDLSSFGFGSVTNLTEFAPNQLLVSIKFADEAEHTAHGKSWTSSNDTNANTGQPLEGSLNLRNIISFLHLGYSFSLRSCPQLTVDSIITVFEALQTVSETKTVTIGNIYISKLTAEQIAIATDKGWTVA
jgi:surface protein